MGRCRPWFSATLRPFDFLPCFLCHLHALFYLKIGNRRKLPLSVVVIALIVHFVPVVSSSPLESGDLSYVFDLSASR